VAGGRAGDGPRFALALPFLAFSGPGLCAAAPAIVSTAALSGGPPVLPGSRHGGSAAPGAA